MSRRIPREQWTRRTTPSRTERFWAKVKQGEDCWEWQSTRSWMGYGQLRTGPRGRQTTELAHRVSWQINVGPIPRGMAVLHCCDNPPCVRPSHLFLGTQLDNIADMVAKGRHGHGGRLASETVRAIRAAPGTIRAIGTRFGVAYSTVGRIRRGEAWKEVA